MSARKCHLARKENKGKCRSSLHSFVGFRKGTFRSKSSIPTGRNDRLHLGKLLNLTEHFRNKTRQYSKSLL